MPRTARILGGMNVDEFVAKWAANRGREMGAYVEHFNDLCKLLGEKTPNEADPNGDVFAFQKGSRKEGEQGFADVWMRGNFAWEYKGKGKDLENPGLCKALKRDIARLHTLLRQRELKSATEKIGGPR